MSFCRSASSHRLGPYHSKTPKHQFANYPLRKTKAKDFELANYEILLDQVNAALALPCTPSELEIRENFKKDLLDFIAEREAEILAEHLAEKVAKCQLHRVSAKARIKTTAKAPKQTAKTTEVPKTANYDSDAEMSDMPWALAKPSSKPTSQSDPRRNVNRKYRVDELNDPPPALPGIRTLLPLQGGDLLTGGTDLKIRRWDHYSPDKSYCICGPNLKGVGNDDFYETKSSFGVQVVHETKRRPVATKLTPKAILAAAATDSAVCHRDSIVSVASVKLNQRLVLSSGRDGAIKVWK